VKVPRRTALKITAWDSGQLQATAQLDVAAEPSLTMAGTYIEMASRFLEPAVLALAVLTMRGRIKL
jgi:hypothetical protein